MADEAFDPVVSTFSKVGRVPFCDRGRMPSSYGARPVCTSGRFAKGFLIGIVRMWSDAPEIISIDVNPKNGFVLLGEDLGQVDKRNQGYSSTDRDIYPPTRDVIYSLARRGDKWKCSCPKARAC